jgi:hypothetical protein
MITGASVLMPGPAPLESVAENGGTNAFRHVRMTECIRQILIHFSLSVLEPVFKPHSSNAVYIEADPKVSD